MREYHKIQTVYKRDSRNRLKTLLDGEFSLPEFEYLKDNIWTYTEKVDGTNIRVMWNGKDITFGGKTDNAQLPTPLVKRLQERFLSQVDLFKYRFGEEKNVCFYNEGYGAKIQSGGKYRPDQDIVLFDIKIAEWWLQREDVIGLSKVFNIDVVPIIGEGTINDMVNLVKRGFTSMWGDFIAEGIVARPKTELRARSGCRIITKIKYKDFERS